jgi:hypothetical protein
VLLLECGAAASSWWMPLRGLTGGVLEPGCKPRDGQQLWVMRGNECGREAATRAWPFHQYGFE